MALYIDSAFLDDITAVTRVLPLAGVTTNPTILLAARQQGQNLTPHEILDRLLETLNGTIFMQLSMQNEENTYHEAMNYIEIAPKRVVPKIPITQMGMRVAMRIKNNGHAVAFTAVTTVAQAYAAAMIGADFIIPYYNRMQRCGVDAAERLAQMAKILHNQQLTTRILAASIKTRAEAANALLAGAHDITAPRQVLLEMITDPDTEEAVNRFEQDWQKMKNL
jgi:TalC/MipB family fructose-6-phosphate aldolase